MFRIYKHDKYKIDSLASKLGFLVYSNTTDLPLYIFIW